MINRVFKRTKKKHLNPPNPFFFDYKMAMKSEANFFWEREKSN